MSEAHDTNETPDDDLIFQLLLSKPLVAGITPDAVSKALAGFALAPVKDMAWISRAIQGAVFAGARDRSEPDRASIVEVRDKLAGLANETRALWLSLFKFSATEWSVLWDYDFHKTAYDRDANDDRADATLVLNEHKAFADAVHQLDWLSTYLTRVSRYVGERTPPPRWQQTERRNERIFLAMCLSPVFATAFNQAPTLNKWVGGKGRVSLGPWADFFQRIMALVFEERATPDLEGVLTEARRKSLKSPVTFGPGIMPK